MAYVANFYKMITSIFATNYSLLQIRFILCHMGWSLCSRSLWLLSWIFSPSHYSKKKNFKTKSPQRSRPLAKVRVIISLRSFSFAGFHHSYAPPSQGPGWGYQWSFKPSTWPSSIQKIKDHFNTKDDQRRLAINDEIQCPRCTSMSKKNDLKKMSSDY